MNNIVIHTAKKDYRLSIDATMPPPVEPVEAQLEQRNQRENHEQDSLVVRR